jgi:hypothetical protein
VPTSLAFLEGHQSRAKYTAYPRLAGGDAQGERCGAANTDALIVPLRGHEVVIGAMRLIGGIGGGAGDMRPPLGGPSPCGGGPPFRLGVGHTSVGAVTIARRPSAVAAYPAPYLRTSGTKICRWRNSQVL